MNFMCVLKSRGSFWLWNHQNPTDFCKNIVLYLLSSFCQMTVWRVVAHSFAGQQYIRWPPPWEDQAVRGQVVFPERPKAPPREGCGY